VKDRDAAHFIVHKSADHAIATIHRRT
jgi:hypothetical protein